MRQITNAEFIKRAENIHGKKYDYTNTIYNGKRTKITVKCYIHDNFEIFPYSHLNGAGCRECYKKTLSTKRLSNINKFIAQAINVHGSKYDYSESIYKSNATPIKINCLRHGIFLQIPSNHLLGHGCNKCAIEKNAKAKKMTEEQFISKLTAIHGNKYILSKVNYINSSTPIILICKTHGDFSKRPNEIISKKSGCPECAKKSRITINKFLVKSSQIHLDKYTYPNLKEIKNNRSKINIQCQEHGIFQQRIDAHLNQKQGCPHCNESKGEKIIEQILKEKKIFFIRQHTFPDCKNPETGRLLKFDFFLPNLNLCIEFDGRQHFYPIKKFGGEEALKNTIERDQIKNDYCKLNVVSLIRIKFNESIYKKLSKL